VERDKRRLRRIRKHREPQRVLTSAIAG
jgi:hypothetical protein